mgnify:CR=1 FL=1
MKWAYCLLVIIALILTPVASAQVRYVATKINPPEDAPGLVTAINNNGQVAGWFYADNGNTHSFLWDSGVATDISYSNAPENEAVGINDKTQIVGTIVINDNRHGYSWQDEVLTDIHPSTFRTSIAVAVNETGLIVGSARPGDYRHPVVWAQQDGGVRELRRTVAGITYESGAAFDVNESKQIVGILEDEHEQLPSVATLWDDGSVVDLGTLSNHSSARSINDLNQVVGWSEVNGHYHAFFWENGVMSDIGSIEGKHVYARDINNRRQIVGFAARPNGNKVVPLIWNMGHQMQELNPLIDTPGIRLREVYAINDKGQIIALGKDLQSYLLTPKP